MRKQYTNSILLTLCLSLGACSSVPLPFVNKPLVEGPSAEGQVAEAGAERAPAADRERQPASAAVVVPRLNSGSQALFDRGVELLREGKLDAAFVLFTELTTDQPELAGPWVNIGYIHLAQGDPQQAGVAFTQALAANPDNCDALNQMGIQARRDGRFNQAEGHYQRCLSAQPLYADAQLNLAILYELYMGRFNEALAAYNNYQSIVPEPDNKVNGWVMDLERRVEAIATR